MINELSIFLTSKSHTVSLMHMHILSLHKSNVMHIFKCFFKDIIYILKYKYIKEILIVLPLTYADIHS